MYLLSAVPCGRSPLLQQLAVTRVSDCHMSHQCYTVPQKQSLSGDCRMNDARSLYSTSLGRRGFCGFVASMAFSIVLARLPSELEQLSKIASADQDYLLINGWVLTCADIAAAEMTPDVV